MKISYNWLNDFVNLPLSPEDLAERLLLLGFEVASFERRGAGFSGVVVAQILDIQKHPNADRLSLCRVTDGSQEHLVVCGARNIQIGQKVPLAKVGAKLHGGRVLQRAVIRGTESNGMLCSASELGISGDASGILILGEDAALGRDAAGLVTAEDAILEVEITPNRPDVLSHFGLARELAAYFRLPLEHLATPELSGEAQPTHIQIEAAEACPRYLGREFSDLKVAPSPAWMAERLQAVGVRPINNIVDVTNYVLMECGQPLHAFDAGLLEDARIRVRYARSEEKLQALDGREYVLDSDCLVIADGKRPVALAGIIGGEQTGVTAKTTRAFLESAHFAPAVVRRTARRFKLRTESSYRFERGTDPELVALASARAAAWILKHAGGRATLPADHYPQPSRPAPIEVSWERVRDLLSTPITAEHAEERIRRLSETVERTPSGWILTPPSHRRDLTHVQDVAEEIARLDGFDLIPDNAAPVDVAPPRPHPNFALEEIVRQRMPQSGFLESYNYDFVSIGDLEKIGYGAKGSLDGLPALENPLSADWQYLRPTLLIGLLKSLGRNLNRGAGNVRLFEIGKVYSRRERAAERNTLAGIAVGRDPAGAVWQASWSHPYDFYRLKGAVSSLMAGWPELSWSALPAENGLFHPGRSCAVHSGGQAIGTLGLIHPLLAEAWDARGREVWFFELDLETLIHLPRAALQYAALPVFPFVDRDLSMIFEESVPWERVCRTVSESGRPLATAVDLVDVFVGHSMAKGHRSLTLRVRLQSPDRTLTDAEIEAAMQKLVRDLESELKGRLRA